MLPPTFREALRNLAFSDYVHLTFDSGQQFTTASICRFPRGVKKFNRPV